jgi:pimeloyl-ACP methyl ester carboxylesterase
MANFVLVHGGFVGGWYWGEVAQRLEKAGHRVDVVEQLPSAGPDPSTLGDLAADAAMVRQCVESVGEPVVLVGHSSGGTVITELADLPSVDHSVYLAAAWPSRGQSMLDMFAGAPPSWVAPHDDGTLRVTDDLELRRQTFCADVDPQKAEAELRRMLPQSMSSATAPSSAPDRQHPTTYIICENDQAIPPAAQEQMAAKADHVERLASSHQPMTSMPDELAAVLLRVHRSVPWGPRPTILVRPASIVLRARNGSPTG